MKKILALSVLLFAQFAHADETYRIFIDLDNSPEELQAAQAAAQAASKNGHHETLVIIPPRTDAEQAELNQIFAFDKLLNQAKTDSSIDVGAVNTKRIAAMKELQKTFGALPISSQVISKELSNALQKNTPVTSVVVSGHYAISTFQGELGNLSESGFDSAFVDNPAAIKGIRSIYGMGCYTAIPPTAKLFYGLMPNLVEVGGYNDKGWDRFTKFDSQFLSEALMNEAKLLKAFDERKSQTQLDLVIRSSNILATANESICFCNVCTSKSGDVDINEVMRSCSDEVLDSIGVRVQAFYSMMFPTTEDNSIYCDTASSPMRKLYTDVNTHARCATDAIGDSASFAPYIRSAPKLIEMVHFQNVVSNFAHYYADDLKALNAASTKLGFSMLNLNTPLACVGPKSSKSSTDRLALIRWIDSLPESSETSAIKRRMTNILTRLQCVPSTWINPPDPAEPITPPDPTCVTQPVSGFIKY